MKKVKNFMNTEVVYFKADNSIFDVAKIFSEHGISGAPVVEKGKVIGVISETDIVNFMKIKLCSSLVVPSEVTHHSLSLLLLNFLRAGKDHLEFKNELDRISKTKVEDMMSREIVAVKPDTNLFEAAILMEKHDVNRLPVIKDDKLIGIIARADLIKALVT